MKRYLNNAIEQMTAQVGVVCVVVGVVDAFVP